MAYLLPHGKVGRSKLRGINLAILQFLFSVLPLIWGEMHYFNYYSIAGDLGDSRFNMYVLEHGFRWMVGKDLAFWSAPFFYPARDVIAYSDNLLGSLPFYAVFRWMHYSRESAFQLWMIASFFLNYVLSYWVMRKFGLSMIGAIIGSYLFTFGLPVMGQVGHAQLFARFMVPIGLYFWLKFLEKKRLRDWSIALGALLWQIYMGIYTGYFLGVAYVLTFASRWFILQSYPKHNDSMKKKVIELFRGAIRDIQNSLALLNKSFCRPFLWIFGAFIIGLLPLVIAYGSVATKMGGRSWNEISSMLPRISSYFRAPQSMVYGQYFHWGDGLPLPWEHMIFVGFIPFFCLVIFPFWIRTMPYNEMQFQSLRIFWGSLVFIFFLTLEVGKFSLYWPIAHLPGADAIRAVTRFTLVMLFPVGIITGAMLSTIMEKISSSLSLKVASGRRSIFYLLSIGIIFLLVKDQLSDFPSYSKKLTLERVSRVKADMLTAMQKSGRSTDQVIVWVNKFNNQFFERQIDAMLSAQDLGIPTVNGYSGNVPRKYSEDLFYLSRNKCTGLDLWIRRHAQKFKNRTLLIIGDQCPSRISFSNFRFKNGNSIPRVRSAG